MLYFSSVSSGRFCVRARVYVCSPGKHGVMNPHYFDFRQLRSFTTPYQEKGTGRLKQQRYVVRLLLTLRHNHSGVITHSLSSESSGPGELCGRVCILPASSHSYSCSLVFGCRYMDIQKGSAT